MRPSREAYIDRRLRDTFAPFLDGPDEARASAALLEALRPPAPEERRAFFLRALVLPRCLLGCAPGGAGGASPSLNMRESRTSTMAVWHGMSSPVQGTPHESPSRRSESASPSRRGSAQSASHLPSSQQHLLPPASVTTERRDSTKSVPPTIHLHNHDFNGLGGHVGAEVLGKAQAAGFSNLVVDAAYRKNGTHNDNTIQLEQLKLSEEQREAVLEYNHNQQIIENVLWVANKRFEISK